MAMDSELLEKILLELKAIRKLIENMRQEAHAKEEQTKLQYEEALKSISHRVSD